MRYGEAVVVILRYLLPFDDEGEGGVLLKK